MADNPYPPWVADFGTAVGDQYQDIADLKSKFDDAQYEWNYGSKDQCLYHTMGGLLYAWKALQHSNSMAGVTQPGVAAICSAFSDLVTFDDLEAIEYDLTWEKIVTAWSQADMTGRLWTILAIDFMRKEIWDQPVTTFAMKKGHP